MTWNNGRSPNPTRAAPNRADPSQDRIYRLIQGLMIIDMGVGAGLVVAGLLLGPMTALVLLGAGLGIIGGALFLFFRALAARYAAAPHSADRGPPNPPSNPAS